MNNTEKAHGNSIKITVDFLWRRVRDSAHFVRPRVCSANYPIIDFFWQDFVLKKIVRVRIPCCLINKKIKGIANAIPFILGGEWGIRTLGPVRDYLISSFIVVCYLHGFSCQFQLALYALKPAWNLDFLKNLPENTEESLIGSNPRFFRFWKELRKERKEQKWKGNTRTVRMPTKLTKIWGVLSWKNTQSTGTLFPM